MDSPRPNDPHNGRGDVSVNDILSQLSQDGTVLREIRKIARRGLNQQVVAVSTGTGSNKAVDSAAMKSGIDDSVCPVERAGADYIPSHQPATVEKASDELAFTISKDSDTYQKIFSNVQWYRDSFLIGSTYADQRSEERGANRRNGSDKAIFTENAVADYNSITDSDPSTAMAHPLLLSSAESYLRSIACVDLLKPYATWVVSCDGPLLPTATKSLAQTIPLGQNSCDWAMRENLLWVLKDEEWKEFAKSITTTYVDRSGRG